MNKNKEEQIRENERKKWANWIGNFLPTQHYKDRALLWGIAEAIERNNFGVIAKPNKRSKK